jgi:hypothetical protein
MKVIKRPPNTSIYNTTYFNYDATYERLWQSKGVRALGGTQKGHITCKLRQPEVFVEISPGGKVIIYYHKYDDLNEAVNILKGLVACHDFSLEQDVPRTLQAMQEGIEASLEGLIDPELLRRMDYDNYILRTASPKTYEAVAEGIRNYLTQLLERYEYGRAVKVMENTPEWIITFGITITEEIMPGLAYVETCDRLTEELTSALEQSPYGFRLYGDDRDGEGLSVRFAFAWRPADGPLKLPEFPYEEHWEGLELAPLKEIYPESDSDYE